jgi:hypothetical protein
VVRLIPDDSGFGLGNSGFNFGLSISVCGCTAACVNICCARPFYFVYFSGGDIVKGTRRYSRRLSLLSRSEIIIGSEIKTGVSQSETGVIRNQTHHSYVLSKQSAAVPGLQSHNVFLPSKSISVCDIPARGCQPERLSTRNFQVVYKGTQRPNFCCFIAKFCMARVMSLLHTNTSSNPQLLLKPSYYLRLPTITILFSKSLQKYVGQLVKRNAERNAYWCGWTAWRI